jgi:hypothetical protein
MERSFEGEEDPLLTQEGDDSGETLGSQDTDRSEEDPLQLEWIDTNREYLIAMFRDCLRSAHHDYNMLDQDRVNLLWNNQHWQDRFGELFSDMVEDGGFTVKYA